MVTRKAGGPIEPASGPPDVWRRPAGAGETIEPHRRCRRLGLRRPGAAGRPAARPPARGDAAGASRSGRAAADCRGFRAGPPESVVSRAASSAIHSTSASFGASDRQQVLRRDAEAGLQARPHREGRPRERSPPCRSTAAARCRPAASATRLTSASAKPGRGPGIARLRPMDFGQRGLRQAAAERRVEALDAGRQQARRPARPMPCCLSTHRRHSAAAVAAAALQARSASRALDLRDLSAQGKNGFLRHGVVAMTVCFPAFVPVMFL